MGWSDSGFSNSDPFVNIVLSQLWGPNDLSTSQPLSKHLLLEMLISFLGDSVVWIHFKDPGVKWVPLLGRWAFYYFPALLRGDLTFKWLVSCYVMAFLRCGTPSDHLPLQGDLWAEARFLSANDCVKTQPNPYWGLRILCPNDIIWAWKRWRIVMVIKPLVYQVSTFK